MNIVVTHAKNFDYTKKLCAPLRKSFLNEQHNIFLPYETDELKNSKDLIKGCDVVVAEVSTPSTGQGIELGWADALGKPIICLFRTGSEVSRSLQFISKNLFDYSDEDQMIEKLNRTLIQITSDHK